MQRSTQPGYLRVIDGGKVVPRATVTAIAQTVALRNGSARVPLAGTQRFTADPDDRAPVGSLDSDGSEGETSEFRTDEHGHQTDHARKRRNRSRSTKCNPGPAQHLFAAEVIRITPRTGVMVFITINPQEVDQSAKLHRDLWSALDDNDCDSIIVEDWGEKTNRGHIHAVVHFPDPASALLILAPLLAKYGVGPETMRIQHLFGWMNYRSGRSDKPLTRDLANLSSYITRPPAGKHARLPHVHTSARGVFLGPWRRLMRAVGTMSSVPACEACGLSLPKRRHPMQRTCDNRCRQQKDRDKRKARAVRRFRWKLKDPAFVRKFRLITGDIGVGPERTGSAHQERLQ